MATTPLVQLNSEYKTSVGREHQLKAELDTGKRGDTIHEAMTVVEVWVKSHSGLAYFNVYGSRNKIDWRFTQELSATVAAPEKHVGFQNAYRYIKVEVDRVGEYEIEIVAAR